MGLRENGNGKVAIDLVRPESPSSLRKTPTLVAGKIVCLKWLHHKEFCRLKSFWPDGFSVVSTLRRKNYAQGSRSLLGWWSISPISSRVSEPPDSCLNYSDRLEIWQAPRQQRCRCARQIAEGYDHYKTQSRGFDTSRFSAVRCLTT